MSPRRTTSFRREISLGISDDEGDALDTSTKFPPKHHRYISSWDDENIFVNTQCVGANDAAPKLVLSGSHEIDVSGGHSVYQSISLNQSHALFTTIKVLINEDCDTHHNGDVKGAVTKTVNQFLKVVAWMFRCGRYNLKDVEPKLLSKLASDLAVGGWWQVLNYAGRFEKLFEKARADLEWARSLAGRSNSNTFRCNIELIRAEIKLPIEAVQIPHNLVEHIATLSSSKKLLEQGKRMPAVTERSLYQTLAFLNRCALMDGFDSFKVRPFAAPCKKARDLLRHDAPGRTENLSVEDVVTIFSEALKWTYVRAEGVILLCEVARAELEANLNCRKPERVAARVTAKLRAAYPEIASRYDLPDELPSLSRNGPTNLRHMLLKLEVSCAISILFNHGRRREEVVGHGKPYGIYRGCLTPADGRDGGAYLDIYVEKTLQRYVTMWANEIVSRAVDVLERLGQTFRPLNTPILTQSRDRSLARQDKLFVWRHFSHAGFSTPARGLDYPDAAQVFFSDLNVQLEKPTASHIYRRCFALIYFYRYDHPVLIALSNHLCHFTVETTRVYVTDRSNVGDARSVERLFAAVDRDDENFDSVFKEAGSQYFEAKILQILRGEKVGGRFARIVARISRKLETSASFKEAPLEKKAALARKEAEREGYFPEPKANITCVAGTAQKTKRQANCYAAEDDRVAPERASPEMCANCVHGISTANHRSTVAAEIESLKEAADDTARPLKMRMAAQKAADELTLVLQQEVKVSTEMQALMVRLVNGWMPVMLKERTYE